MFPMDTQIYPLLDKDTDESYPKNRYHQYIKLLTHAYSFGRIDLYFLIFEWLAYLAYTILSVLKLSGSIKWDWGYTSFPLYIGLGTGVLRSFLWYGRYRYNSYLTEILLVVRCQNALLAPEFFLVV